MGNPIPKLQYIKSFDCLRGFAIVLVMLLHGNHVFFKGGWIGVDLFFVLSGYLITSLLQNEYSTFGSISFSKFYIRRALRLFPPLLICILIANILWGYTKFDPGANQIVATFAGLFYFTNFLIRSVPGNMAHLWSLSVEEHFYFFWPIFALLFVFKRPFHGRINFMVTLLVIVTILRILAFHQNHHFHLITIDAYRFTVCRIDSILLGSLLAFIPAEIQREDINTKNRTNIALLIVFLLLAFVFILLKIDKDDVYLNNGGFILTNLLCVGTVWFAIKKQHHAIFSSKVLSWIGKRSYGIYAYHLPIFLASDSLIDPKSIVSIVTVNVARIAISFGLAALSFKYVETPILKLKNRYQVKKAESVPATN
ncbi:acyltransferase [Mucilaginibacter sp. SG564]|uniref:acyltransferase family protein n=1 Tax=Mucilaginibacter sp. SG564 TaxID=2587022 RepID=UPI0015543751|nr:acyltransferase [Mucilaginibacter sp. SG564]NOW97014.1 peptidoglycan/LPS O-acetylase OafA/YrhL [Mucilaginibacter sp. SG564]